MNRSEMIAWAAHVELERCRRNPIYWLERYCYTVDEHLRKDNEQPIVHGPKYIDESMNPCRELDTDVEDDYLLYCAAVWHNNELTAFPKSRQLRMTHLMVNLHGWLAWAHPGQRVCVQSKKEEDADATLQRLRDSLLIMRKLHPLIQWPTFTYKYATIIFPNGSIIKGVAQGAAVVRQYTYSAIFSDEMAFQAQAEDAYTAAIPTIEGGGRYTAVSTPEPGFFQKLVFDRTDVD